MRSGADCLGPSNLERLPLEDQRPTDTSHSARQLLVMRVHATLIMLGVLFTAVGCYHEQINSISKLASVTKLVDRQVSLGKAVNLAIPVEIVDGHQVARGVIQVGYM